MVMLVLIKCLMVVSQKAVLQWYVGQRESAFTILVFRSLYDAGASFSICHLVQRILIIPLSHTLSASGDLASSSELRKAGRQTTCTSTNA